MNVCRGRPKTLNLASLGSVFCALLLGASACSKASLINTGDRPDLNAVVPPAGPFVGGQKITIAGANFLPGATVLLDGQACQNVQVQSSSSLTCVTPPHAIGPVTVTIINITGLNVAIPGVYSYKDNVAPVAGFAVTSGGGVVTGSGLMLQSALGEPTTPMINAQPLPQIQELSGVQGVLYEP